MPEEPDAKGAAPPGEAQPDDTERAREAGFLRPFRIGHQLNPVERWKLDRHPFMVRDAVVEQYSVQGAGAIALVPGEPERLKWVGIYPQRQGGDAFMLRLKIPGGRLTAPQARVIGEIAGEFAVGPDDHPVFGNRYVDVTTRQDIQMHWIHIEDVPEIWRRLESVGITTAQACGDSARNVTCCPVSGIDPDEVLYAAPVADALTAYFTGNREYSNLPRKWKISVAGCLEDCNQVEINDVGLVPARAADGRLGFNLLVGGGLSDGERMATDVNVFLGAGDAIEITRTVGQIFSELGNRENRGVSRMRYLVQELGAEAFRAEMGTRCRVPLEPRGEALTRRRRGDHLGVHPQKQSGLFYVGCNVTVGRLRAEHFVEFARLAEAYGDGEIRLANDQNLLVTGIPEDRVEAFLAEELLRTYSPFPGPFQRGVVACTGSEFCRFAVVETKARALAWARELDERLSAGEPPVAVGALAGSDPDDVIRMHFSGCPASCAQPQIADIGFRGETAHRGQEIVEAVDVGLGGSLGPDARFIDWVEGAKPVDEVPDAIVRLVERFRGERSDGERFYEWARRVPNPELRSVIRGRDHVGHVLSSPSEPNQ